MKKRVISGILLLAIILAFVYIYFLYPVVKNNRDLKNSLATSDIEGDINFNDLIPFSWDEVYSFPPYFSKEEIAREIGFNSFHIRESVNENMLQMIFVKNQKIVSNIVGYPKELGFDLVFKDSIKYTDKAIFTCGRIKDTNVYILKSKTRI